MALPFAVYNFYLGCQNTDHRRIVLASTIMGAAAYAYLRPTRANNRVYERQRDQSANADREQPSLKE